MPPLCVQATVLALAGGFASALAAIATAITAAGSFVPRRAASSSAGSVRNVSRPPVSRLYSATSGVSVFSSSLSARITPVCAGTGCPAPAFLTHEIAPAAPREIRDTHRIVRAAWRIPSPLICRRCLCWLAMFLLTVLLTDAASILPALCFGISRRNSSPRASWIFPTILSGSRGSTRTIGARRTPRPPEKRRMGFSPTRCETVRTDPQVPTACLQVLYR